ncbi:MAG TPA: NAD(P)-dependent oxidoreductase [Planctomycetota bacterium]|nr:NAD(P)-dependent oxidoreductase [Planctomycetota bacterium]
MSPLGNFKALAGQRCIVFGGAGFLGRWVARELCAHGARLTLPVRDLPRARQVFDAWEVLGDVREADLSQAGVATALVELVRPALVFNLAGYGVDRGERDPLIAQRINTDLPEEICVALSRARDLNWGQQAFVHTGSALEYGRLRGNLVEEGHASPATLYGKTKLHGTQLVMQRGLERGMRAIVARLFTVYGPGEHSGRLLPALLEAAKREDDLALSEGLQRRDFTYAQDAAEGLVRLALVPASVSPEPRVVNLATGTLASVREFSMFAARVLAIPPSRLRFGAMPTRAEEMEHAAVSIDRLRSLTSGWTPQTTILEGIERTLAFLRERGPLP